jgi:hypothetical protein
MERGKIELPGFHKEWAEPTYKIVRFLVIAFAVVMIFPYLPGSDSPAFRIFPLNNLVKTQNNKNWP